MKSIATRALLVTTLITPALAKAPPGPEVLVVADVLLEGGVLPEPTAEKPVHYVLLGGIERDLGGSLAGLPPTPPGRLRESLVQALTRRHFIESRLGEPIPAVAIVFTWGTALLDTYDLLNVDQNTAEETSTTLTFNQREIFQLLGINKARQRLMSASDALDLTDALHTDRLYIFVAALDLAALRQRKIKPLWRTRMSIEARGTSLAESMEVMLASAAPFFGREEARPVFVDDARRRKVEVRMGDIQVIDGDVSLPAPK
jgi:hypothetical protein